MKGCNQETQTVTKTKEFQMQHLVLARNLGSRIFCELSVQCSFGACPRMSFVALKFFLGGIGCSPDRLNLAGQEGKEGLPTRI